MTSTETPAQRRGERLVVAARNAARAPRNGAIHAIATECFWRGTAHAHPGTACLGQVDPDTTNPARCSQRSSAAHREARMGGTNRGRARVAIPFVVLAIVCVLAGFGAGVLVWADPNRVGSTSMTDRTKPAREESYGAVRRALAYATVRSHTVPDLKAGERAMVL